MNNTRKSAYFIYKSSMFGSTVWKDDATEEADEGLVGMEPFSYKEKTEEYLTYKT